MQKVKIKILRVKYMTCKIRMRCQRDGNEIMIYMIC